MKARQIGIAFLLVFLVSAAVFVAAASIRPTLAQVPTVTSLLTSGTVTPIFIGRTPVITPKVKLPTREPRPTKDFSPTITPSGPLVPTDEPSLAKRFAAIPPKIGVFRVITYPQNFESLAAEFVLERPDGARYRVELLFSNRVQGPYRTYRTFQNMTRYMPNGQLSAVGDGAFIDPNVQGRGTIAAMYYRNVFVEIFSTASSGFAETFAPPTVEDLAGVLEAIVKAMQ